MSSTGSPTLPHTVRVDQAHLIAAALMFALSLIGVAYSPKVFFWLPLLPLVFIIWTLRCRTTFTEQGMTARYLFLPGVSFNSLVTLADVTDGRIPDPVTPTLETIDESVRVVHRDSGDAVLMDEEEYADYESSRRASYMAREELARRQRERDGQDTSDNGESGSGAGDGPADTRES